LLEPRNLRGMETTRALALRQEPDKTPTFRKAGAGLVKLLSDSAPDYDRVERTEVERAAASSPPALAAFLRFLWATGARISEALAVTRRDVDFAAGTVRLSTLKRRAGHVRVIPVKNLGDVAALVADGSIGQDDRIWTWSRAWACAKVATALRRSGVEARRGHAHAIRHGRAFALLGAGVSPAIVQRVLGHASITTTGLYLKATGADIRSALRDVD